MNKTENIVFKGLTAIACLIFIGLSVEAGGLIANYIFAVFKPEVINNLYQKLDLTEIYENNPIDFYLIYSFISSLAVLKAVLFYIVAYMLYKMDLKKPFNDFVATKITHISYLTLIIGLLNYIGKSWLEKQYTGTKFIQEIASFWVDSEAFILMGAVIYIIARIFKTGVELQKENELTV